MRKIIKIDTEKYNGCGACARACHEGAIDIIDGKARLTRENYCDGLGDCLPECPTGAITFEKREAPAYDKAAVLAAKQSNLSQLAQWPCQIKLVPVSAPYFNGAKLLIAADCTAYAYKNYIKSILFLRMEVPCCGGLEMAAKKALQDSRKSISLQVVTISIDGKVL